MKKEVYRQLLIVKIRDYYVSINRDKYPPIDSYTIQNLEKCLLIFGLS